jgi:uncharacterized protein (TIGR02996 family)
MDLEQGFLDDVVAHPHDPTPWLVFADWLEENEDPRSEIVRVWQQLRQEPKHPEFNARRERLEELFNAGMRLPLPRYTNYLKMEFVWVPPGEFWMGGGNGKPGKKHVVVAEPFWMQVYLTTQALWKKVMRKSPSSFDRKGDGADMLRGIKVAEIAQFPVECVSWHDAHEFLDVLNKEERGSGWEYYLPTETEWEYALRSPVTCKADCGFSFYFEKPTNSISSDKANFDGNFPVQAAIGPWLERTTRVGLYPPNRLGLYDMHGNVWEWMEDAEGPHSRVRRGGSWHINGSGCAAANRETVGVTLRYDRQGFRLIRKRIVETPARSTSKSRKPRSKKK